MGLTTGEIAKTYTSLRQAMLSRHVAVGRFYRSNLLAQENYLSVTAKDLASKSGEDQVLARWTRTGESRENTLLWGGRLVACLAVEEHLGLAAPGGSLRSMVQSLYQNYRAEGPMFGYPLRWDVATSTRWDGDGSSEDFLYSADRRYVYNPAPTDPRWAALRSEDAWGELIPRRDIPYALFAQRQFFDHYRRAEPSMDELCGLVAGYSMAARFTADPIVRDDVRTQAGRLGDYLAGNGYLLVRPSGGFTARGASGVLPALELAFNKGLGAASGRDHAARADFVGACVNAGVWPLLRAPYERWTAAGVAATPIVAMLAPVWNVQAAAGLRLLLGSVITPVQLAQAYAVYAHRDCFDVKDDEAATEFAIACLLHNLPADRRFSLWMTGMGQVGKGWASGFPPLLGLSAIDDPDRTVADAFLGWYDQWRRASGGTIAEGAAKTCTAAGVACVLRGTARDESDLVALVAKITHDRGGPGTTELEVEDRGEEPAREGVTSGVDLMTGIALGWLHAHRRAQAGQPVATDGFPVLPDNLHLTAPSVPTAAVTAARDRTRDPKLDLPIGALQGVDPPAAGPEGVEILWGAPRQRDDPLAAVPAMPTRLVHDQYLNVSAEAGEVCTYAVLRHGDAFDISAQGLVDGHGPDGSPELVLDARAPVHVGLDPVRARRDALVMRLNGYVVVGDEMPRQQWLHPLDQNERMIYLRLNHTKHDPDVSGSYLVRVRVWSGGPPLKTFNLVTCAHRDGTDPGRAIDKIGGQGRDGTRWHMDTSEVIAELKKENTWVRFFAMSSPTTGSEIRVRNRRGKTYLSSTPNRAKRDNLSTLPPCLE